MDRRKNRKHIDETGNQYGRLTVLALSHEDDKRDFHWFCRCSYGVEKIISGHTLRRGQAKSCGCLHKELVAARCKLLTGDKHPNWTGGRKINAYGYVQVLAHGHPKAHDGYVYEHILVAERALGEYLPTGSVIHHINGIKDDNRLENLWWFKSRGEHIAYHNRLRPPIERERDSLGRYVSNGSH